MKKLIIILIMIMFVSQSCSVYYTYRTRRGIKWLKKHGLQYEDLEARMDSIKYNKK